MTAGISEPSVVAINVVYHPHDRLWNGEPQLLADGPWRLKSELEASVRACVDEFKSKVLARSAHR